MVSGFPHCDKRFLQDIQFQVALEYLPVPDRLVMQLSEEFMALVPVME